MTNEEYIESVGAKPEVRANMLAVLEKYGDNKWWLSNDPRTIGFYQLNEPIVIVNFVYFQECLTKLLGRDVYSHEFAFNYAGLKKEALKAWNGTLTDEDREAGIRAGLEALLETGKPVLGIVIDDDDFSTN